MNSLEWVWLQEWQLWVDALSWIAAGVALLVSALVLHRANRERRRLEGMRRDLEAFAEASTRVADTLDHLLRGTVEPATASVSSRRYLLVKARECLEQGEAVETIASKLGLCEDEKRLLEFFGLSGRRGQVRVA